MNHQEFVNLVDTPCALLQVERTADGCCGDIHILCANSQYKRIMGPACRDGMLYQDLVPKDPKFEDFCFRAAFLGQRMHAYVETRGLDCWTDMLMLPMQPVAEDLGLCQFLFEFTKTADAGRMATVSVGTAEAVIKACITLMSSSSFRESVGTVLQDILDISSAYDCRILLLDDEQKKAINFSEKRSSRAWPIRDPVDTVAELPYALVKTWEDSIGVSNNIIIKDKHDMDALAQRNPEWVSNMRAYGVTSLILSPLRQGERIIGYLYIVNYDTEKFVELKELVELMSFFLGSEISNHLLMDKLNEMSHTDGLTRLRNRNAMIRRMRSIEARTEPLPFGVINLDLNGLKRVNDTEGHEAGDGLLVRTAEALTKVFYHEDIFRTGGDEFIIIATDIAEDTFLRKAERLRELAQKPSGVSFALGACWSDGTTDLKSALRDADESMYADKQAYYAAHPEMKRR